MNQNAKVVDDLVVDDCYICFTAEKSLRTLVKIVRL